jgi:hypothetical protein
VIPVEPADQRELPAALRAAPLDGGMEQGRSVQCEGVIVRSGPVWRWPSSYGLARHDEHGRPTLVCYILGNSAKLQSLLGRNVTLSGDEYWVHGVRRPVVMPQRVVLRR